jgi:hypothetical protein
MFDRLRLAETRRWCRQQHGQQVQPSRHAIAPEQHPAEKVVH